MFFIAHRHDIEYISSGALGAKQLVVLTTATILSTPTRSISASIAAISVQSSSSTFFISTTIGIHPAVKIALKHDF